MSATETQIARINELSGLARTAWFTLLGYLVFVGITLLGVRDADFFVPSRQTDLPLVGVEIPTASFFWTAPILGAALYTYLHLFLIKLWDAHAEARTTDADPTHHWLVNDFVLLRQHDPTTRARPLSWLVTPITLLLVWAAAPIVLAYAWWRSMPAHNEWLTLLIATCLWLTLVVGIASWWRAEARLRHRVLPSWMADALVPAFGIAAVLLVAIGWVRTDGPAGPLAKADLAGVRLVNLPEDWRSNEAERKAFRVSWCEREALPMPVCDHLYEVWRPRPDHVEPERRAWCDHYGIAEADLCARRFNSYDARFHREWTEQRRSEIAALNPLDLRGADLRSVWAPGLSATGVGMPDADLRAAFLRDAGLEGADLRSADLMGANLELARLERSNLSGARLEGALLRGARLDEALIAHGNLRGAGLLEAELGRAILDGANLSAADLMLTNLESASLVGADLSAAVLTGTVLWGARLDGAHLRDARILADLRFASFLGADWDGTRLRGAAHGADLRGARHLTQAQLDGLVGDEQTLLPDGVAPDTGRPFVVWTCWSKPLPELDEVVRGVAALRGTPEEEQAFRATAVCNPDHPRLPAGTPCAANVPREACVRLEAD